MIQTATVTCPYCWERVELSVDPSAGDQDYVEDCPVCCQPMLLHLHFGARGRARLEAERAPPRGGV
ncbi:MAG: CPXCG motif-containing cysteine-rich protein [Sinobacteraceae bacterium]|nr:CPXCG motif-containing cysteine-rich protein [Nevskiaceae bacterium]